MTGMINMKKWMLMGALVLCAPAVWAVSVADKVSCAPERVSKGGLVNTTVCEVPVASLDDAYRAVYYTTNRRVKGSLRELKLPDTLPAKSTKLLVALGGKRDCGSKTKINGEWVDDIAEPKMELEMTRHANQVRILAQEIDGCADVENFVITFKRAGKKVKMVYEWHHS